MLGLFPARSCDIHAVSRMTMLVHDESVVHQASVMKILAAGRMRIWEALQTSHMLCWESKAIMQKRTCSAISQMIVNGAHAVVESPWLGSRRTRVYP